MAMSRRRERIAGELRLASAPRLAALLRDAAGSLLFEFEASFDAQGRPGATLTVRGTLPLTCDLCAAPLAQRLDEHRRYFFVASEQQAGAVPIDPDEAAEPLAAGHALDLVALVEDEAILAVPISPRHPQCQARIAVAATPAEPPAEGGSPFAALAQLRPRRH